MAGNSNSGRRPIEKEVNYKIKTISQQALIELATSKVLAQLENLGESPKCLKKVQGLALPILLKSIKEHKQVDITEVKPLLSAIRGEIVPKLLEEELAVKAVEAFQSLDVAQDISKEEVIKNDTPRENNILSGNS